MGWTNICRIRKRSKCVTQEQLDALYTNEPFHLAENYAEVASSCSLAIIFGPGIPILNVIALSHLVVRYHCDWIIFLRGACRPPNYDEVIAEACINAILFATVLRCFSSGVVFGDQFLFPEYTPGCGIDPTDITNLRAEETRLLYTYVLQLLDVTYGPCNNIWFQVAVPC